MPPNKPLNVEILRKDLKSLSDEDVWLEYQEYGVKAKSSTSSWSCYVLAKEGEQFGVRCTNTTGNDIVARISVDACYVQQYLLRPAGVEGDTVTCDGTGSHTMVFRLVSALTRAGNKHSRPPSETGCISITVYQVSPVGSGIPPPEKPTEQLELPVSMDGTFWKLCVRLAGCEMVIGQPSPHAADINAKGWKQVARMDFNYRTEEELFSGRIRGIEVPSKRKPSFDTNTALPATKRKREPTGDDTPKKRRDLYSPGSIWKKYTPSASKFSYPTPSQPEYSPSPAPVGGVEKHPPPLPALYKIPVVSDGPLSSGQVSTMPKLNEDTEGVLSDGTSAMDLESPPFLPWPGDHTRITLDPPEIFLQQPSVEPPRSQPEPSVVAPAITPPLTPHNNPEPAKSTAENADGTDRAALTLVTFLDDVSPHRPIRFLEKDLQATGISTLAELTVVARRPEEFRTKIPVLAELRDRDQYLWMMLKKKLTELLEEEPMEQLDESLEESDPVGRFTRSLGAGGCINLGWLAENLREAGIASQKDLLVLSRNLERYAESIPFLQVFATSNKFGWTVFQIGLEGLPGRRTTPIFSQTQDHGADMEGYAYIKHFLDTIDSDKPLGYLADGFVKAGLSAQFTLLDVAEDIKFAVGAMPFLQDLATGDQLVWAMIVAGLENLSKST
ncbi:hypothetical protein BJ322DRAFT_1027639 [Thelephora terrestris]|uniref:Uncharacterized protein n=1 Tax=Thelephora terrestris TaxID=56493 RepID=A0A9P6HPT1_9AGAM|nr:hypothetical protein BJ322DRAFT_1027639 [Thelephora terrestris]